MKTHEVIDTMYYEDEGQGCFVGTLEECEEFMKENYYPVGMEIVPMTKEQIDNYPDNQIKKQIK